MPDIFLSYSREDQESAARFAESFEREGFAVWWDQTLRSGEAYDEVTEEALRSAGAVVVLWSKTSVASRWVRAEATAAHRNGTLLPAMIEPCERPIMFELTQTADLSHWTGDVRDRAWRAFVADLRRLLPDGRCGTAAPEAAPSVPAVGGVPLLAVLPISSRSDAPEDEEFAEVMTEDVTSALSLHGYFRVIAGGTAAAYRGKALDLRVVGRELDARYVVEGGLRRIGTDVRLTFQLVEAANSNVLWSFKYVRPSADLAGPEDGLASEIANDIADRLLHIEFERAKKKTSELSAWERVLRSRGAFFRLGSEYLSAAIEEARQAVAIAPDFGLAHGMLAMTLASELFLSGREDPEGERQIREHIKRALHLDGDNPNLLNFVSNASRCIGDPHAAFGYSQRAVQLVPNVGMVHHSLGACHLALGRPAEAIAEFDIDERLAPNSNVRYVSLCMRALANLMQDRAEEAAAILDRSLQLNPTFVLTLKWKAIVAALLGRTDEARVAARRMREAEPGFTLENHEAQNRRMLPDPALAAKVNEVLGRVWEAPAEQPSPS